MEMRYSKHAQVRLKQRALRKADVDFILQHGSRDGELQFLCREDVQELISQAKLLISIANRLKGKSVVVAGNVVVTAYHDDQRRS